QATGTARRIHRIPYVLTLRVRESQRVRQLLQLTHAVVSTSIVRCHEPCDLQLLIDRESHSAEPRTEVQLSRARGFIEARCGEPVNGTVFPQSAELQVEVGEGA